ncbi:MAG: prepilin-type N-terminal cleavage/methylation domain-containing protein [Clostridium sp.]|nr:prepilin-type N-terminal cleavage/methylation domain-containing protein [Clostridium sp.]MCM1444510.1 prepilin-type N-terminal cleavage/methylation domain-containing protein [Candidatus Amulumruptor caecigallinarius]
MKLNKKGFTLVELLAIIVILAIIALITVPIITNIIKNVQESADARSVEAYASTIEKKYYMSLMTDTTTQIENITIEETDYSGSKVECTGKPQLDATTGKMRLEGCKVEGRDTVFTYYNGAATKTEASSTTES